MPGAAERRVLVRRIRELASTFLPPTDPTGSYTTAQYDQTSAFLLLAHAEVEWFLERRCQEVVDAVVKAWEIDGRPRAAIVALAAFAHAGGPSALPSPGQGGPPQIRQVMSEAKKSYSQVVSDNNGIKEPNLLKLLLPVGVRESQFPQGFLADMNTFGTTRGTHAHRAVGAKTPPDPVDAKQLVTRVLVGLRRLDRVLVELATG